MEPWEEFQQTAETAGPWAEFKQSEAAGPWKDFEPEAPWETVAKAIPGTALGGAQTGVGGTVRYLAEHPISPPPVGPFAIPAVRALTEEVNKRWAALEPVKKVAEIGAGIAESGEIESAAADPGNIGFWKRAVLSGVSSTAQMAPGLAASLATKSVAPALAGAAVLEGGQAYQESREKFEPERATQHAQVSAAAEVLFEMLPTGFLVKNFEKKPILDLIFGTYLREIPTEILTTAVQEANRKFGVNPGMTFEEYTQSLLDTVGSVMVSAPLTGGMAAGLGRLTRGKDAQEPQPAAPPAPKPTPPIATRPTPVEELAGLDQLLAQTEGKEYTEAELAADRQTVEQAELERKKAADIQPATPGKAESKWWAVANAPQDPTILPKPELGKSKDAIANDINYPEVNTGSRLDWKINIGPEWAAGKTLRELAETDTPAGTMVIGEFTEERPAEYMKAYYDTIEQWRAKYMPDSSVVISLEKLPSAAAIGAHYGSAGQHLIIPATLRRPSQGLQKYNRIEQTRAFFNAPHEFGHALVFEHFLGQDIHPEIAARVRAESEKGIISEGTLAALPEAQQAVIREFNALRQGVANNSLTAQQFIERWANPSKVAWPGFLEEHGVAPDAPARQIVRAMVNRSVENMKEPVSPQRRNAMVRQQMRDMFSIDEFLAEQTARYAYLRGWDKSTPLGQFFSGVLRTLQNFFANLKREGWVKPGTAFTEWMDGLPNRKTLTEATVQAVKQAGPKAQQMPTELPPQAPPPEMQRVDHNFETSTREEKQTGARRLLAGLRADGTLSEDDNLYQDLKHWAEVEDWDAFRDVFQDLTGRKVRFQIDSLPQGLKTRFQFDGTTEPTMPWDSISVLTAGISEETARKPGVIAEAAREWKEKGFSSRFFKAWFGDWETDPGSSSKVTEPNGRPLIVYHATRYQHEKGKSGSDTFVHFGDGDIGFHTGTSRAAHIRGYRLADPSGKIATEQEIAARAEAESLRLRTDQRSIQGMHIIPLVMNLKNPLDLGTEDLDFWASPRHALFVLKSMGVIDQFEKDVADAQVESLMHDYDAANFEAERVYQETGQFPSLSGPTMYARFEPVRRLLTQKGYDGFKYHNTAEGDTSWVALHPNQMKSLLSSRTFSRSLQMHMELDFDRSTPQGVALSQFWKGLRNFFQDPGPVRRALRRVQNLAYHTLQIQQLAHLNPEEENLVAFSEFNTRYNVYKAALQAPADEIVNRWSNLSESEFQMVNKFVLEEFESGEHWFELVRNGWRTQAKPNARTVEEMQKRGINANNQHLAQLILDAKNDMLSRMDERMSTILERVVSRYSPGSPALQSAVRLWHANVKAMHAKPWFPQGRFGNYLITIEGRKADDSGYEVIFREAFESQQDWQNAWNALKGKLKPDQRIRKHELGDKDYVLMSVPLDFIDLISTELDLSSEEVDILMNILQPVRQDKALQTYLVKEVPGYSRDALRSYANYAWHDSNFVAKLKYRANFNNAIRGVQSKLRQAELSQDPQSTLEVLRLRSLSRAMERARDYIMSPPNEAQSVRAFVSIAYLGLNVKTALINFYGLVTTWSDMVRRKGYIGGSAAMAKATAQMFSTIRLTDLNAKADWNILNTDTQTALDRALKEGVLSQSYAYHLAGMANASNLHRLPARNLSTRVWRGALNAAMYPFRLTELGTRRVSFLANYEEARKTMTEEEAYHEAVNRTNKLQNDYSLGNRVPFMRGIKVQPGNPLGRVVEPVIPLATIFWSFAQHMAFHAYGGYELGLRRQAKVANEFGEGVTVPRPENAFMGYTMRIWILTLLMAGYEGLPGAENLLDLLEAAWRKWGGQKPIRQALREYIKQIDVGISPQEAAHGLGHNLAGFDISRSVGFGRMVPGTDSLAHPRGSTAENVGTLVLDMMGATGSFIHFGLESMFSDKPLSETMKRLPGGMGNLYTAYKWSQEGVRASSGSLVTRDLETGKIRDLTAEEIWGKALGFNPTVVSQERAIRYDQYDRKIYWQSRRKELLDDYWRAQVQKSPEAIADTKAAIAEFNKDLGPDFKHMRIRGADIAKSRQTHRRQVRAEESGRPVERRYRELYKDIRESYREGQP